MNTDAQVRYKYSDIPSHPHKWEHGDIYTDLELLVQKDSISTTYENTNASTHTHTKTNAMKMHLCAALRTPREQ